MNSRGSLSSLQISDSDPDPDPDPDPRREALDLYESLVQENLLGVSAALLANLCVCKVLAGRNGDAEALMTALEVQEAALKLKVQFRGDPMLIISGSRLMTYCIRLELRRGEKRGIWVYRAPHALCRLIKKYHSLSPSS